MPAIMPELRIEFDSNRYPVSAVCTACRAAMPRMKSEGASSEDMMRWFSIQFNIHKKRKHKKYSDVFY
jgi:hypothetical protein